eukprot:TRINITY_DN1516_c0_g1_i4.p1 TRINITY_DN1516_c0_g1~~TRINITY_DN1516_c0_g1_i4.p1  ORF type:complete len:192 (+),score=25.03 TRINITY_DN1516_c0_g1_i4:115-690(+)
MASLSSPLIFTPRIPIKSDHHLPLFPIHPQTPRILSPLQASGRISNYKQEVVLVADRRNWSGGVGDFEDDGETDGDEEEDDRSLDLLVRFVHNVFRKVSRRARKAVRSVIPLPISTKLVGFSVNGVIILAFLWILKAFLEVVCTLGSIVFVSILLIRGVWSGVSYLQESRNGRGSVFDDENSVWTGAQPAS